MQPRSPPCECFLPQGVESRLLSQDCGLLWGDSWGDTPCTASALTAALVLPKGLQSFSAVRGSYCKPQSCWPRDPQWQSSWVGIGRPFVSAQETPITAWVWRRHRGYCCHKANKPRTFYWADRRLCSFHTRACAQTTCSAAAAVKQSYFPSPGTASEWCW